MKDTKMTKKQEQELLNELHTEAMMNVIEEYQLNAEVEVEFERLKAEEKELVDAD